MGLWASLVQTNTNVTFGNEINKKRWPMSVAFLHIFAVAFRTETVENFVQGTRCAGHTLDIALHLPT
jgi:hypothetical protein